MSFDVERLYELLPAFYRIRDTEQGGPLKALLSVIAEQVAVLEEDLDQLYDDQFIETCAEWVVPYIGDLVGTRGLFVFPGATKLSQRAQVANTIAYRRRKGTAAVLEQLARDVTGWNASVVEYFQLLATTQYMNHLRPENLSIASLRRRYFAGLYKSQSTETQFDTDEQQWKAIEYLNTPFDRVARTVDVRRIESRRGKYNIPNIGVFLWRLGSYPITDAPAYKVPDMGDASMDGRRYLFDALGKDTPLYNRPETEDQITHLAEPINVPMPISRRVLNRYLDTYYGVDKCLLLNVDGKDIIPTETTPPSEKLSDLISVCNLSDLKDASGTVIGWANMPQDKIAIDPVLGRIAFPTNQPPPANVHVTYHYGFSAEMGGGEYGRAGTFDIQLQPVIKVPSDWPTIQAALDQLTASGGVVEIQDNEYYVETPVIRVPAGKKIELRAADERRPVLVLTEDLLIVGGEHAEVTLNGLLISGGSLRAPLEKDREKNELRLLRLRHCTILPGPSPAINGVPVQPIAPRLIIDAPNVTVEIDRCIVGTIRVVEGSHVRITTSILDASVETEVAYAGLDGNEAGAPLKVENSTIIGRVHTSVMELASNTIFLASFKEEDSWPDPILAKKAPVLAERLQQGCVRFSYVPLDSQVPRRYHCQPKNEDEAARVRPVFTSLRYGDPGYCQLSQHCAPEIRRGADDEAEMGAFHNLYQPQREANLRVRLDEYLRFGLEAGIFYAG